ncbi:MAG: metallophosphoesterase [Eubacteriales bacterium]|nr:metallophosphoesterase [Eubacteriales bacterium]
MRFNSDGKFKIMQITDMQEIPAVSADTINLLEAAVEAEKPDLVVYTGDQIKGYGVTYKGKGKELEQSVAKTISTLLEPVTKRNIPFAVTFGNHDRQVGISNADQFNDIYKALPNCIGQQAEGIDGGGTYNIPIKASDGSDRDVFNLYLFDSGTDAKGGGYEAFDKNIIEWYKKTRDELKEKNGNFVPSIVFQHIPLPEYYNVLKQVKKNEKGAIQAFRTHKNEFYKLGDTCRKGDMLEEPPSIPDINNGEFDAISEKGDVLAVFVGHDHKNSFVGRYKNVDLGFTQSSGFNVYGNRTKRGVRCFVLDESKPNSYETYTRTYEELVGTKVSRPVFDFISSKAPATVDAAIPMIIKAVGVIAAVVILIILLTKLL